MTFEITLSFRKSKALGFCDMYGIFADVNKSEKICLEKPKVGTPYHPLGNIRHNIC